MSLSRRLSFLLTTVLATLGIACGGRPKPATSAKPVRILFLHHSTGDNVWRGGALWGADVAKFFATYNKAHGRNYQISERWYPAQPLGNYPYDYWNLWVNPGGPADAAQPGLQNLETLTANFDVIIFKHCFPVSGIRADSESNPPSAASSVKTAANYKLQYAALKARLKQFPNTRFILWTGAVLTQASTTPANAQRAKDFFDWVKGTWDEPGDNIFLWDFYALETEGSLYMKDAYADSPADSHPARTFSRTVVPLLGRRIVDVVEGRGDTGPLTGK